MIPPWPWSTHPNIFVFASIFPPKTIKFTMKLQSIALVAASLVSVAAADDLASILASANALASSIDASNGAFYSLYYAELSSFAQQFTTGYYGAINSFYQRSDVASAISGLDTITADDAFNSYLQSFNSKYYTELSSIYSQYSILLVPDLTDDGSVTAATQTASPSNGVSGSASTTAGSESKSKSDGSSAASGSASHSGSHSGSSAASATSGASSSSAPASSSSSKAGVAAQTKPLMALTGLFGALSVLLL